MRFIKRKISINQGYLAFCNTNNLSIILIKGNSKIEIENNLNYNSQQVFLKIKKEISIDWIRSEGVGNIFQFFLSNNQNKFST